MVRFLEIFAENRVMAHVPPNSIDNGSHNQEAEKWGGFLSAKAM
jgi:hypothetical protein